MHRAVKQIANGESQAQAVAVAVNERLARLQSDDLTTRLLAIGRKTASRMSSSTTLRCFVTSNGCRRDRRHDTSAIIAILRDEDDAAFYGAAIAVADVRRLSAVS